MPYTVNTANRSANRKTAQVTILIGEGSKRRSVTRHIGLVGCDWVGSNPDPRAIPMNEKANLDIALAKSERVSAENLVKDLKEKLEAANDDKKASKIADQIEAVTKRLEVAKAAEKEAKSRLAHVERELPLKVTFDGPGLTY